MTRTITIAVFALIGGWFSGDFAYNAGMGGLFLFAVLAIAWPCLLSLLASRGLIAVAALPGMAMGTRISVINHLDPRFYNDLNANILMALTFAGIAFALSLVVSVPVTVWRRSNPRPQLTPATRDGQ